ncbi:MAG: putative selenate reductase subunit YgfK, partial [Bacteroidales bacterium]
MVSDQFFPTPLPRLLQLALYQINTQNHLFGIPRELFFTPASDDPFRSKRFGQLLETPVGVAAGPHTQLSQNIVAAWITGSRFIELKTIQTLDELEVTKPCIDMQDEGYNCEWSQELKIAQSFDQYLDAWILIHILRDQLGMSQEDGPGTIFNMSVGYDMAGIMKDNVQWFLNKMQDASPELDQKIQSVRDIYPRITELDINPCLSDNVTLSTMHGCPPEEIEKIASYLLGERKLHTAVKFNPTLLGKERLHAILGASGFDTQVPDQAFEHDLQYGQAVSIINNLQQLADTNKLQFSLKLTNTLESLNHKQVFPPEAPMMYNSGRSLHPLAVNLASRLQHDFQGALDISFSGGAHAFNITDLIACGMSPVTICTELLKPGGYGRTHQIIDTIRKAFQEKEADSLESFITSNDKDPKMLPVNIVRNLSEYAARTLESPLYKKQDIKDPDIKTQRPLNYFDCIHAPCVDTCPTSQNIPGYSYHTSQGNFIRAAEIVNQTNPFPRTTGMICDHLCQLKCTRINYDQSVRIREIKRFVAEAAPPLHQHDAVATENRIDKKVAIIGAGPSGLTAARFLAQAGFQTDVFEKKKRPGGMVSGVIPAFRLKDEALEKDIRAIEALGVRMHFQSDIDAGTFKELTSKYNYIYIAAGAQKAASLDIPGIDARGVADPLQLLERAKNGSQSAIGPRVVIIGGGNTAMDTARTAFRLAGEDGKVSIIYRRTVKDMPADTGEIKAVLEEGIEVMEMTAPVRINTSSGKVVSITCCRMKPGEKDQSGRPRPVMVPGSEFDIPADLVIPAIGQEIDFDFGNQELLSPIGESHQTRLPGVFIGGDAQRGASTAIHAIGDGRQVARHIIEKEGITNHVPTANDREPESLASHLRRRAIRIPAADIKDIPVAHRMNFNLVSPALTAEEALEEAKRCLLCDEVCSICTTVCPNLALFT